MDGCLCARILRVSGEIVVENAENLCPHLCFIDRHVRQLVFPTSAVHNYDMVYGNKKSTVDGLGENLAYESAGNALQSFPGYFLAHRIREPTVAFLSESYIMHVNVRVGDAKVLFVMCKIIARNSYKMLIQKKILPLRSL